MSSEPGVPRWIDAAALRRALPVRAAVDALESAFRDLDPSAMPLRSHLDTPAGGLLLMPAVDAFGLGVKLVTLTPDNPDRGLPFVQAVYVLFDAETQAPAAVIDGASLTALRTASVSALATQLLARPDARRLVIFGAGVQAAAHLETMAAVRPFEDVVIVSRSGPSAEALAAGALAMGLRASTGDPQSVREADVLCTCTTSDTPVFDGTLLREGAHVNAVGAYRPQSRELDDAAVRDAGIVVETRDAACAEAGDLLQAFGEDTRARIDADLQEVVRGTKVHGHHTVFESVGLAFEDLVVARTALTRRGE